MSLHLIMSPQLSEGQSVRPEYVYIRPREVAIRLVFGFLYLKSVMTVWDFFFKSLMASSSSFYGDIWSALQQTLNFSYSMVIIINLTISNTNPHLLPGLLHRRRLGIQGLGRKLLWNCN